MMLDITLTPPLCPSIFSEEKMRDVSDPSTSVETRVDDLAESGIVAFATNEPKNAPEDQSERYWVACTKPWPWAEVKTKVRARR